MDFKLELIAVPVSDVDRAKAFYEKAGFNADNDVQVNDELRFVQLTPPGSNCSISIGTGLTPSEPGSYQGMQLVVTDIEAARDELIGRGVDVGLGRCFCLFQLGIVDRIKVAHSLTKRSALVLVHARYGFHISKRKRQRDGCSGLSPDMGRKATLRLRFDQLRAFPDHAQHRIAPAPRDCCGQFRPGDTAHAGQQDRHLASQKIAERGSQQGNRVTHLSFPFARREPTPASDNARGPGAVPCPAPNFATVLRQGPQSFAAPRLAISHHSR